MRVAPLLPLCVLVGCSEFGFGAANGRDDLDEGGLVDDPSGGAGDPDTTTTPFPGEDPPPGWGDFDASCRRAAAGPLGAGTDHYVVDEPIDGLVVLHTTGNLTVVPRPGPVEVEVVGVAASRTDAATVSNGTLTLDYVGSTGNIVVHAPADLLTYDLRVCVGNLEFSELGGTVAAEVRVGNVAGRNLAADVTFAHNPKGNVDLTFDTAPSEVWMEGNVGNHKLDAPISDCDCDLDVGVGTAELDGVALDPNAATAVFGHRTAGNIAVTGR